ncbi:MAG: hypothetical protein EPO02_13680 [Nitrospirae bacterium]|nr:MAG: hypothetical protein EPO02_13680 [Nitrospirota bacterium]
MVAATIKIPRIFNVDKPGVVANPGTLIFNNDTNQLENINLAGVFVPVYDVITSSEIIFVDGINGNDSNDGNITNPLLTYEAARLLAVSRNPQYGSGQTIVIMTTLNQSADFIISPFVNVLGLGKYVSIIGTSGNFVLDTSWGTTPVPNTQIMNVSLIGQSFNFVYSAFQDGSSLRFENCSFQLLNGGSTATITGSNGSGTNRSENIIFDDCTLDFLIGTLEPQYISDNVNMYFFNTSVSNIITASVTSTTIQAKLLIQNAIDVVGNITVNAVTTGTLTTDISASNTSGTTLTINGTSNAVRADSSSSQFGTVTFSGGATSSNLISVKLDTSRSYSPQTIAFSTPRTPSITNDTFVVCNVTMGLTAIQSSTIQAQVNSGAGFVTIAQCSLSLIATTEGEALSFIVPANASYQIVSSGTGTNTIVSTMELTL